MTNAPDLKAVLPKERGENTSDASMRSDYRGHVLGQRGGPWSQRCANEGREHSQRLSPVVGWHRFAGEEPGKATERYPEKREPSYTVGRNVNWCSYYGKQYGGSLTNLK